MGLQLFSKRKWEDNSFHETNVQSVLLDAVNGMLRRGKISSEEARRRGLVIMRRGREQKK